MTTIWSIEGEEPVTNQSAVVHTFLEPGVYTVSLLIIDELGLESHLKSYLVSIENPLPLPVMTAYEASLNGELVTSPSDNISEFEFWHPLMNNPDPNSPSWNGITSYTWNFGDASPISSGENIWHTFTVPGSYLVTLTVRDGYGTGDTNQTHRMIHVSSPPTILVDSLFEEEIDLGSSVVLILSYEDEDINSGITAFRDTDILSDSDSDGILDNDPNQALNDNLRLFWDIDPSVDENEDGDFQNDWIISSEIPPLRWNESGEYTVIAMVCDDTDACTIKAFQIEVADNDDSGPRSLSDFDQLVNMLKQR